MPQAPLLPRPPRRQLSAICELVLNCLHQQKGDEEGVRKGGVARRLAKCLPILINGREKKYIKN